MAAHLQPKHRRQAGAPPPIPTGAGFAGASTIIPATSSGGSLQTDPSGDGITQATAPAIATGVSLVTTATPTTSTASSVSDPASTGTAAPKSSSADVSVGTAIAACVGGVAGAILLVLIALWFYRRYNRNLKSRSPTSSEKRAARPRGNNDRSKKRSLENWNKMEEVGEESKIQTKQIVIPTDLEQMTMFQKSPSVRSPASDKGTVESSPGPYDRPFGRYLPTPAKVLSESPPESQRPFISRADPESAPSRSWDEAIGKQSLLPIHPTDFEKSSGNKAIPTPPAVVHELHKWESAEVLHFDANPKPEEENKVESRKDSASIGSNKYGDPFVAAAEGRTNVKRVNNPFFNAQDFSGGGSNASPSPPPLSLKAQGKQRALDPFTDATASPTISELRMPFARHTPSESTTSYNSDRAIQSLINVLDVSEADVQERLRIASMQPSFVSASSYGEEADVASAFPHPPP